MASRRSQFLQREPWVSPKAPPAIKPPSTRRPPKRDPRTHPWRPSPKPKPGPLFPSPPATKKPAFGRRPPHVPLPAGLIGKLKPLRPFLKLHPLLWVGLTAWELYDLWQWWQRLQLGDAPGGDSYLYCRPKNPPRKIGYSWARFSGCQTFQPFSFDGTNSSPPPRPNTITGRWLLEWQESGTTPNPLRGDTTQMWFYADKPAGYIPHPYDEFDFPYIAPSPAELPYPYPFAPQPMPIAPPITRPGQEPAFDPNMPHVPAPQPAPRPAPAPRPTPGLINPVPSINWTPGQKPLADFHERRPPTPEKEKEKKKRLKPGTAAAWTAFLGKGVGSYTELDDATKAIYKGLPWKLRRWKGRDGVWRDRDHTSVRRAKRLFQYLGQLDVETAITELIKQELTDKAFGTVGNKLKKRAKELGDEGLWSSSGGFQRGGNLQKKNWDEVYKKLKKEAAANQKTRTYTVRERQSDGSWRWVKKQRPTTQIPWYRQKSVYTRNGRPGTYYAPTASYRNIRLEP